MNLAHLSLVHVPPRTPVPAPPTNTERLRAFRAAFPQSLGNPFFRFPRKPTTTAHVR